MSGGPYGLEDTVGSAGAGMGLLLIIINPFIWSLPTALMVAEMGTTIPVQGGYYHWSKTTLGPFWGFLSGWWMWVVSWVDMAIYPVLFTTFAANFGVFDFLNPDTGNPWLAWLVRFAMIVLLGVLNVFGAKAIGDSSKVFLAIVLAPFVLVTIIGVFNMDRNPVEPFVLEGLSPAAAFGAGLFVVMWNYMGWDSMSTFASEIDNPKKSFPKALAISIPLITLCYLLPTLVSLAIVGPDQIEWTAGAYTVIAEEVGGKWLGFIMNAAALLSAVGLYASWMLSNSRIPFALAEDGYLPASIAKLHPKYGSPWISILVCSIICSAFILGPFQGLVAIDVTVYAFALALEFASLIALRRSHPDLERPFKVPGGWIGVFLATLFPMLVTVAAIWFQVLDVGAVQGIGWAAAAAGSGVIAYFPLRRYKARNGRDVTYTIEMIERGEFVKETAE